MGARVSSGSAPPRRSPVDDDRVNHPDQSARNPVSTAEREADSEAAVHVGSRPPGEARSPEVQVSTHTSTIDCEASGLDHFNCVCHRSLRPSPKKLHKGKTFRCQRDFSGRLTDSIVTFVDLSLSGFRTKTLQITSSR